MFVPHADGAAKLESGARVRVLQYGLQRSGSVLINQILRDAVPDGVVRTHDYVCMPSTVPVLVSIRDPRACVVSNWRFRCGKPNGLARMTDDEVFWYAAAYKGFGLTASLYLRYRNPIVLVYEKWINDWAVLFNAIEVVARTSISSGTRKDMATKYCAGRNRAREGKHPLLDIHHVGPGDCESWRDSLSGAQIAILTELLSDERARLGYGHA